jgi:glycosyltransferase involved in cell wall biosynthesis
MRIFIAGLARNCEKNLQTEIENLMSCFEFADLELLVVESDSSDGTVLILNKLCKAYSNFNFISLGNLAKKIPDRVSRITLCRNKYLEKFYQVRDSFDYLVVADLDGVNRKLNRKRIELAMSIEDWSMISANQLGPYYDLWALRAKSWLNEDCHSAFKIDFDRGVKIRNSYFNHFIRPMFRVRRSEKIEVSSAFGGLAIYRTQDLGDFLYSELSEVGEIQCEHINFNRSISESGGKLFIVPKLYNSGWTVNAKRSVARFIGICIFGKKYFSIFRRNFF